MRPAEPDPSLFVLRPPAIDARTSRAYAAVGGPVGLARAIAHAPGWTDQLPATVVVRSAPTPLLGVIGRFDESGQARLAKLQGQLDQQLPRLLYLDYPEVESSVALLASILTERFGHRALAGYRFTAIPRGGYVVLGLLSYALGLERRQLTATVGDARPTIVVDDCALSGLRFRQYLADRPDAASVVFAPLASSPELRAAIERDPMVKACVSAVDLRDAAREPETAEAENPATDGWRHRRSRRPEKARYWVGLTQHVCFPWNEPDAGVWNPATQREESGWPLLPPERCAKHRAPGRGRPAEVQVQPPGRGRLRPADDVLFGTFEDRIVIAASSWPSCLVLDGVARAMWLALVAHGEEEAAAGAVATEYDANAAEILTDLRAFTGALRQRGALVG